MAELHLDRDPQAVLAAVLTQFLPEPQREQAIKKIKRRLAYVEEQLKDHTFLLGEQLSVADIYLFTVLRWTRTVRIDISEFTRLNAYFTRIAERPAVTAAVKYETESKTK